MRRLSIQNFCIGQFALVMNLFLPMLFVWSVPESCGQESSRPFLLQIKQQASELKIAFAANNESSKSLPRYSPLAISFLDAADTLAAIEPRKIYVRKNPRSYLSPEQFRQLSLTERESYSEQFCDERLYYGHYSTPLAWTRPFDRLGQQGFNSLEGKKVLDFGFGNVGQLRMLASLGASVTGIEISDSIPSAMYYLQSDQGTVSKISDDIESNGELKLVFGKWPADKDIIDDVGVGFDLFISKNVLKYGYIHPEREAPGSQLIDLGVNDEEFLMSLFDALNPGGFVLIYNIHPPRSKADERYKPWA